MANANHRVDTVLQHAQTNPYTGPAMTGNQYAGWPVKVLEAMVGANYEDKFNLHHALASLPGAPLAYPPMQPPTMSQQYSLEELMAARMRWGKGGPDTWAPGFAHMAMHGVNDVVHVWIITTDGKSVVLEDEIGLYPSDGLITKLRMLESKETPS